MKLKQRTRIVRRVPLAVRANCFGFIQYDISVFKKPLYQRAHIQLKLAHFFDKCLRLNLKAARKHING
jgi:hypothetical protein